MRRRRLRRLRRLLLYLALRLNKVKTVHFGIPDWMPMPDDDDKTEESKTDMAYHYQAAMSVNARNKLLDVVRKSDEVGQTQKRSLLDALELAERVPGTLKERLDWDKAKDELAKWDKGLADFLKEA